MADSEWATEPGWDVFETEAACSQIQRIDELDRFESDDEAKQWVEAQAIAGDERAARAIGLDGDGVVHVQFTNRRA